MRISDWSSYVCSSDLAVADVARFVELPHVEQVAGVLPIQRGHQLAGVQLVRCQNRQLELDAEQIAGLGAQRPPDRKNVVLGKIVTGLIDLGGCRVIKKKNYKDTFTHIQYNKQR